MFLSDGRIVPLPSHRTPPRSLDDHTALTGGASGTSWRVISVAVLALVLALGGIASAGLSAQAETVTPVPSSALAPTTVTTTPDDYTLTGAVRVSGTRQPGSSVVVTIAGSRLCAAPAAADTQWACMGDQVLPNGAAVALTATETPTAGREVPESGTSTVDVLSPPVLDGNGMYLTTGLVSGTGFRGSQVTVTIEGVVDANCGAVPVSGQGYWSCNVAQGSGGPFVVRAQQSNGAIGAGRLTDYSPRQSVTIDRDAPASAVITSPGPGARVTSVLMVVGGTGESGASVDLYVDNVPVCGVVVAGGSWSCSVGNLGSGDHVLVAVQRDAAGNFGAPSGAVTITVGAVTAAPAPIRPTPTLPTPGPTPAPVPVPTPVPVPSPEAAPVPVAPLPSPGPPTDWSAPQPEAALVNWGTPTGFGADLAGFGRNGTSSTWLSSVIIGVLFLALVALPLRLLVSALRGRVLLPHSNLWGRNRRDARISPAEMPRPVNAWLAGSVPLAAAAALIVFSGGINGEVRYVRLLLAVGLGLVILNVVGAALAVRLGAAAAATRSGLRFLPLMLLASVIAVLIARLTGVSPPLLVGVLAGAVFAAATPVRQRAVVNLVQVGAVLLLAILGWIAHGLLGTVDGFWPSVASETLATVCLAGLGSALVLVLPIATLPGRVVLEWSPVAWMGTVLVVGTVGAELAYGDSAAGASLIPLIVVASVFAALSLATWTFVRFVEPRVAA